jgi:hypothetical protein
MGRGHAVEYAQGDDDAAGEQAPAGSVVAKVVKVGHGDLDSSLDQGN